jgi:hypothetical protein
MRGRRRWLRLWAPMSPAPPSAPTVHEVYAGRLASRRAEAEAAGRAAARLSNARLAVFLLAVLAAGLAFGLHRLPGRAVAVPALAFAGLVVWHDRALRRQRRAERAAAWYDDGLARIEGRFAGRGVDGARFRDPHHPYADDLDLFGSGGLFELLCRARTTGGEATLAGWLLAPAEPATVRSRQAAVAELREALDLREHLAVLGEQVSAGLHAEALVAWGAGSAGPPGRSVRGLAAGLAGLSVLLAGATLLGTPLLVPWLAVLAAEAGLAARVARRVRRTLRETDAAARDLGLLARLLTVLETTPFRAPRLVALCHAVAPEASPAPGTGSASGAIARLERLAQLLDARRNQLFAPFGAAVLFTTQVAFAVEAWRARYGPGLETWVAAVGELEALASLAAHACEHPADAMPEIVDAAAPLFDARDLGHPLLAESRCVRNDVRIDDGQRVLVVSGSNMSGKSTLLRAVGSNAVLALAGAPVRAGALRLSPLSVGASIRVVDSLQEGQSRFYAEIQRLRQIVALTDGLRPVLFLLDEILHGTNSHDRRIGAEAVVRSLVARGAGGLVTTHDLALAALAESPALHAANVHFEDQLLEGRMQFDYRMRPGIVTRSNAIALMRAVGLEV